MQACTMRHQVGGGIADSDEGGEDSFDADGNPAAGWGVSLSAVPSQHLCTDQIHLPPFLPFCLHQCREVAEDQIVRLLRNLHVLKPLLKQEGHHGANRISCASCPEDTYKNWTGPGACHACPPNALADAGSTSLAACVCKVRAPKARVYSTTPFKSVPEP
jgi:hypothetical protein